MTATSGAKRTARTTILLVEDDRELQDLYVLLLADEYDTLQAFNGQEAVDLYVSERPDLILMDIKMPVMTGSEAIARIMEIDPEARILAVTAYRDSPEDLGVPVLRKGFTVAELLDRVRQTLHP